MWVARWPGTIVVLLLLSSPLLPSSQGTSSPLPKAEASPQIVELSWERSREIDTIDGGAVGAKVEEGLVLPTVSDYVWDDGDFTPEVNMNVVPAECSWASWPQLYSVDVRRFKASFTLPSELDPATTLGILYDPCYQEELVPINDNLYLFVNGVEKFRGGTNYGAANGGFDGTSAVANETDGWYIPQGIEIDGFQAGENVIDIVAEERDRWGGIGYLLLRLTPIAFPPTVDLSISDIVPIQVVEHPRVDAGDTDDLVHDKPMVVRVKVNIDPPEGLSSSDEVTVRLEFRGVSYDQTRTVEEILANDSFLDFPAERDPFNPGPAGDAEMHAVVDPNYRVPELNEGNNDGNQPVTVKDTRGLYLISFELQFMGDHPTDLDATIDNGARLVEWTYPIAQPEFQNQRVAVPYSLDEPSHENPLTALVTDALLLWYYGQVWSLGRADRVVAVVPESYLAHHLDCGPKGTVFGDVAFVTGGHWSGIAHELGHSYGLGYPEEYTVQAEGCEVTVIDPGPTGDGYNVQLREPVINTVSFMGTSAGQSLQRWATLSNYIYLFRHPEFLAIPGDPELLLVAGQVSLDGKVELGPTYRLAQGTADIGVSGPFSLRLLDSSGSVVYALGFDADFILERDPLPPMQLDTGVFMIAAPYPHTAQIMQIERNGELLLDQTITGLLLHDALDAVPDYGFSKNPDERRNAMHRKIDAVEAQIRAENFVGAINKLRNDVRKHLDEWLVDDYQLEDILQYSKEALLTLVDEMVDRLEAFP